MKTRSLFITAGFVACVALGGAVAQTQVHPAVKARQSIMTLYANNLGQLGAMAKGDVEYNAEAASAAATNLVLLTQMDQSTLWPQGTDNASTDGTRALPAMWENFPDVMAKGQAMSDAALAMQAAAGTDLDSLRGAMGALGGACGGCHKAYRAAD